MDERIAIDWLLVYNIYIPVCFISALTSLVRAYEMVIDLALWHSYGNAGAKSVPMARGKHLFPFRTQQLRLAAVTILGVHPWENSTVPNYIKAIRIGWLLSYMTVVNTLTLVLT